jgi:tRNA A-37 threonylcarbamoyl transferase component Bud32
LEREQLLDEVIAAFLEAEQSGKAGDRDEWLQRYPELADDLRRFFEQHDRMARLAAPLREVASMRSPNDSTATLGPGAPNAAASEVPRAIGEYEILEVVARGGMGVVYKARHPVLKRTVALKMLRADFHAAAWEGVRFKAEAEAVARLQHPNIVQIHEVGEADGRPFIALEFAEGGNLAQRLGKQPQPPREAARLVETLAAATHLAHARGIVHRDLKPANVLLAADGTPKIADFGLAKQLDASSEQTQTGTMLGTPAYMAPEQASGQSHTAGPAADVYGLGAILYEALTGRPPFRGRTPLETLEQVKNRDPDSPARLNPKVPRDLETICLKCLHKEPEKRYSSARELADDLGRFGRGEPVLARPVGTGERLVKWVRRRPAVAGLLAAVLVLALVGGGLSTHFGLRAQAASVREANERAERALERKGQAEERDRQTAEAGEKLESTLAESLARPLGYQDGPPSLVELDGLWDLAGTDSDRVRLLFFEKALARPDSAARLTRRAELAVQAAVGVDLDRRDRILARVAASLRDGREDPAVREACASLGVALGKPDEAFAREDCRALIEGMARTRDPLELNRQVRDVVALASWLSPPEGAQVCAKAVPPFLDVVAQITGNNASFLYLQLTLERLAERLPPEEVAQAARQFLDRMARTGSGILCDASVKLTERLPPDEAAKAARHCLDHMAKTTYPLALKSFGRVLGRLAGGLPPEEVAQAARQLLDRMGKTNNLAVKDAIAEVLLYLAEWMPPDVAAKAAQQLIDLMVTDKTGSSRVILAQTLERLAARLLPAEAAKAARQLLDLTDRMDKKTAGVYMIQSERVLEKLAERMPPGEAAKVAQQLLDLLMATEMVNPSNYAPTLRELVERLPPEEAAQAARQLLDRMDKTKDHRALPLLAAQLTRLAERLPLGEAAGLRAKATLPLLDLLMDKTTDESTLGSCAKVFEALAERLPPDQATKPFQQFLGRAAKTNDYPYYVLSSLESVIGRLAERLPPDEAAKAAPRVFDLLAKTNDNMMALGFSQAWGNLAERLPPQEAAKATQQVFDLMAANKNSFGGDLRWNNLLQSWGKLAARLPPPEATQAARRLLDLMANNTYPLAVAAFAQELARLAERLPPDEAARLCAKAAQHVLALMAKIANPPSLNQGAPFWLSTLGQASASLAERLPPDEAARLCAKAAQHILDFFIAKTTSPVLSTYPAQVQTLPKLAERLGSAEFAGTRARMAQYLLDGISRLDQRSYPKDALNKLEKAWVSIVDSCSDQELVELLKHPGCLDTARDTVRAALNKRVKQNCATHWELVAWLRQHRPDLDLTSPPRRSER